jgi:predicted nucleotide-binding protein
VSNQFDIPEFEKVSAAVDDALVRIFGHDTVEYNRYKDAAYFNNGPYNYAYEVPIQRVHGSLIRSKATSIALLEQAIQSLDERKAEASSDFGGGAAAPKFLDKVFVVHGREDGPREAVARFLEKLGLVPIILHEQANRGRTVIEKIEEHADVGFAVVILTPDDLGHLKGEPEKPRARQNVLLELGFFVGKLSRQRVCALKLGDLEIPSDWQGVINAAFDEAGGWKIALAKELEAAEYEVDWNKVMQQ